MPRRDGPAIVAMIPQRRPPGSHDDRLHRARIEREGDRVRLARSPRSFPSMRFASMRLAATAIGLIGPQPANQSSSAAWARICPLLILGKNLRALSRYGGRVAG
jgi:hypothetical protein